MKTKVELRCAYEWTCDECGKDNFARAISVALTPEDVEMMIAEYGVEPEECQNGSWLTRPDEVVCAYCGETFMSEDWEGNPNL